MSEHSENWEDNLADLSIEETNALKDSLTSGLFILSENTDYVTLAPQADQSEKGPIASVKLMKQLRDINFPTFGKIGNGEIVSLLEPRELPTNSFSKNYKLTQIYSLATKLGVSSQDLNGIVRIDGSMSPKPRIQ